MFVHSIQKTGFSNLLGSMMTLNHHVNNWRCNLIAFLRGKQIFDGVPEGAIANHIDDHDYRTIVC